MIPPHFMVIGLQIGKLHRALTDSEKPGLFRVNYFKRLEQKFWYMMKIVTDSVGHSFYGLQWVGGNVCQRWEIIE